ncbi:MAG TPA: discoidin domain-containing protein [Rariglobus sp.]|nr:discoidin domain-containing protein [Rariglobus sp.]
MAEHPTTFCNPVDLSYRFYPQLPSRREAADPVIVWWHGEYWLFASKSGGYWHSKDFARWQFVAPTGLPLENYAPAVEIINDRLYFTAGSANGIFTSDDPAKGVWTKVAKLENYTDPALFADDDGRLYMYYGTSATEPIRAAELDPKTFAQIGPSVDCFRGDPQHHGWELKDLAATNAEIAKGRGKPFLEGAWMNKHAGVYYLQYAGPGTERKWYGDGVYTSTSPMGPFTYAPYSPFCLKATGFIGGTGHGNTFTDAKGNYWHSTCGLIGVRQSFERRVTVFPTAFLPDGSGPQELATQTYLGDYPQYVPGIAPKPFENNSPGWMLLSYKKTARASSSLPDHEPELAFDEDIRSWWSAANGNPGEYLAVDFGKPCEIRAVQINFADEGCTTLGRLDPADAAYRYVLDVSNDGHTWTPCISQKDNLRDSPHDYSELDHPVRARYARLTNIHTPAGMKFSVSGLRVFGSGLGQPAQRVEGITAQRLSEDRRATVRWKPAAGAEFYIIRYGIAPDRLLQNAQVYGQTRFEIAGLNTGSDYYFTVDAINDTAVTRGTEVAKAVPLVPLDRKGWALSASVSSDKDPIAGAIDDNADTRWGTGTRQAPGQWFQVDLGAPKTISQIDLHNPGGDHPRQYEVYLSTDGQNWGQPVETGKGAGSSTTITIDPIVARYVRLVETAATDGPWWSISEINIYGAGR